MTLNGSLLKIYFIIIVIFALALPFSGFAQDVPAIDTSGSLPYPFADQPAFGYTKQDSTKIYLNNPNNITTEIEYDPILGQYVFYKKIGKLNWEAKLPFTAEYVAG